LILGADVLRGLWRGGRISIPGSGPGGFSQRRLYQKSSGKNSSAKKPVGSAKANGSSISHDQVAQLAHRYWIERGRKHGHHEEDWFRAEQELRAKAS